MDERRVGSVIVVDRSNHVCGIVTDRDIAVRAVGAGRSADVAVSAMTTRDLVSVPPTSELAEATPLLVPVSFGAFTNTVTPSDGSDPILIDDPPVSK